MRGYLRRSLEGPLRRAAKRFPAVVLTGPRQSGKTTLLRRLFGGSHRYVSLEPPDIRLAAAADPRGFLALHPPPAVFDEVQYAPDLLPYIKERIDAHRRRAGQYLLTGSQNLMLMQRVTETLAGRAAVLHLLTLSRREALGQPDKPLPWEGAPGRARVATHLWDEFLRGSFPELVARPKQDAAMWYSSYLQTYLERDVRMLRQVGDLSQFQTFVKLLAARTAQLLSLSDLARDLGVAVNTIKAWISVLEATSQIFILRPYFANIGKRLVKAPKLYFTDVGLVCHLVGLRDAAHAASGPMSGAIVETAVVSEVVKTLLHRGETPSLYFWRTSTGVEVDLIVEQTGGLIPVEVKQGATATVSWAGGIAAFRKDIGSKARKGYVVYTGDSRLPLGVDAEALPFLEL